MTDTVSTAVAVDQPQTVRSARLVWPLISGAIIGGLLAGIRYATPSVFPWMLLGLLAILMVRVAVVDERTGRIPNTTTATLLAIGTVLTVQTGILHGAGVALTAAAAAAGVALFYGTGAFLGWWGMGDAKLAGTATLLVAVLTGPAAAYLVAFAIVISTARILLLHLRELPANHPHGAAIAAGAILILLPAVLTGR